MNDELKKVWELFLNKINESHKTKTFFKTVVNGNPNYEDAQSFSTLLSDMLIESASEVYPTDSESILNVLKDTNLCKSYLKQIDNYVYALQKSINESNGLGMNSVKMSNVPQLIKDSIQATGNYDRDIKKYSSIVEHVSNSRVDYIQKENAKFQSEAGYGITVSRKYDGKGLSDNRTCKWCLERAGSNVPYKEAYAKGMFERHEGCHCVIEYNNNGRKTYQTSKGGINSWTDSMGRKQKFEIAESNKKFQVYESEYQNIYAQTYSKNARKMIVYLNDKLNSNEKFNDLSDVVIVKNSSLKNIAGYEQKTNRFYISEELIDTDKLKSLVSSDYFPSRNLEDIINHELGGHKAHWDTVKKYANEKNIGLYEAKQQLEENLRKYVKQRMSQDAMYIKKNVSTNAYEAFLKRDFSDIEHDEILRNNNLNELIADVKVLLEKSQLTDSKLGELVKEVIEYDVSSN